MEGRQAKSFFSSFFLVGGEKRGEPAAFSRKRRTLSLAVREREREKEVQPQQRKHY